MSTNFNYDRRRAIIENLIRTEYITSRDEIEQLLYERHNIKVHTETLTRDIKHINAKKDRRTGQWIIVDHEINRYDLHEMLGHACRHLMHDVQMNASRDTVFMYVDLGTAERFKWFFETLRQDEAVNTSRYVKDGIMAVLTGSDTVVVMLKDRKSGQKFYDKIRSLAKQTTDLSWTESTEEHDFMRKVLGNDMS